MEFEQPGKKQKTITIEKDVTPLNKLVAILITPAILVVCFWAIFMIETEGLSTRANYLTLLAGCIINLFTTGNTECLPDSGYIILCTILGGPFAFFCSYKIWQNLNSKTILTDQKIINKQSPGKEIQLYWSEIKKVRIFSANQAHQLVFTKNKGASLFDDNGRIFCPPGLSKKRPFISRDAANLILKKIDRYNISVKGERTLLEEIIKMPHKSQQGPTEIGTQSMSATNRLPVRPSAAQKPTPK
jgi:hypothetical protein